MRYWTIFVAYSVGLFFAGWAWQGWQIQQLATQLVTTHSNSPEAAESSVSRSSVSPGYLPYNRLLYEKKVNALEVAVVVHQLGLLKLDHAVAIKKVTSPHAVIVQIEYANGSYGVLHVETEITPEYQELVYR